MARTSGTSTTWTRTLLGLPSACSHASVRLSMSSLLNLFMLSSSTPVRRFQPRHKPLHRAPRIRREVIAPCLRIEHQQVKRHPWIMVEVDDANAASFAAALPTPPDLTDAAGCGDNVTGLGVARYEIDELEPLVIGPKRVGLAHEHSRFRYRNRPRPHLRNVRHWRQFSRSAPWSAARS